MDKGIVFETSSGQIYAYVKETNRIITLNNEWFHSIKEKNREESVFEKLAQYGEICGEKTNIAEFSFDEKKHNEEMNGSLQSIVLEITQECTLRCDYCIYSGNYEGSREHSGRYMTESTVKKALDYYKDHSSEQNEAHITLYGGEALIRFETVCYAVEYAKKIFHGKKISIKISTNGTLLTDKVIKWLMCNPEVSVNITLNGMSHDKYRKFPDGRGSLEVIMKSIMKIKNKYPDLWGRIQFLSNVANCGELLDIRKFYMDKIGKPPLLITGIIAEGGNSIIQGIVGRETDENAKLIAENLYVDEMDEYMKLYYQDGVSAVCMRPVERQKKVFRNSSCCMPFAETMFVTADGKIGICEKAESFTGFGTLDKGIDTGVMRKFLEDVRGIFCEKCADCWCQRLCDVCYKDFKVDSDGNVLLPDTVCNQIKKYIEQSLRLTCEISERNPLMLEQIKMQ